MKSIFRAFLAGGITLLVAQPSIAQAPACNCASLSTLFHWEVEMYSGSSWFEFGNRTVRRLVGTNASGGYNIPNRYLVGTNSYTSGDPLAMIHFKIDPLVARQLKESLCGVRVVLVARHPVAPGAHIKTVTGDPVGCSVGSGHWGWITHGTTLSNQGRSNPSWSGGGVKVDAFLEIQQVSGAWSRCPGPISTLVVF